MSRIELLKCEICGKERRAVNSLGATDLQRKVTLWTERHGHSPEQDIHADVCEACYTAVGRRIGELRRGVEPTEVGMGGRGRQC